MPPEFVDKLRKHHIKQAIARLKMGHGYENNNLVFATALGTPIRYDNLDKMHFRPTLKAAQMASGFRLYDLASLLRFTSFGGRHKC